jgi:hypothetical protein
MFFGREKEMVEARLMFLIVFGSCFFLFLVRLTVLGVLVARHSVIYKTCSKSDDEDTKENKNIKSQLQHYGDPTEERNRRKIQKREIEKRNRRKTTGA